MKTFEYALRPNKTQDAALWSVLIGSRHAYNAMLEELISHYKETGKHMNLYTQDKLHGKERHPDLPAVVVDTTIKRLHLSFRNFFEGRKAGRRVGFPRFKGANRWNSFAFRDAGNRLEGNVFKAGKICGGNIKAIVHRPLEGEFRFSRIVRRPSGWYVQCVCDTPVKPLPTTGAIVGLDFGLTALVADSDGKRVKAPRRFRVSQAKLGKQQRHLSRCQKGSNRRKKAKRIVARTHERIRNQRRDLLHKLSREYVNDHDMIVIEDLQVANMVRNHSLALSIMDASWSTLRWMLTYKAESAGRELLAVPPHYTSQKCSGCGNYVPKALSVRTHSCAFCGYVDDRDINAARNILAAGLQRRADASLRDGEGPVSAGESPVPPTREAAGL